MCRNYQKENWVVVDTVCVCDRNTQRPLTGTDTQNRNASLLNPLTPNDPYSGRTAPLTSKLCILYIYSTNTGTEYFKRGIYCPFFLFKMQLVS